MNRRWLFALFGGASAAATLPLSSAPAASRRDGLKPVDSLLTDFGRVYFRPQIAEARALKIEQFIRGSVHARWSAGEDGPWVWRPHGLGVWGNDHE